MFAPLFFHHHVNKTPFILAALTRYSRSARSMTPSIAWWISCVCLSCFHYEIFFFPSALSPSTRNIFIYIFCFFFLAWLFVYTHPDGERNISSCLYLYIFTQRQCFYIWTLYTYKYQMYKSAGASLLLSCAYEWKRSCIMRAGASDLYICFRFNHFRLLSYVYSPANVYVLYIYIRCVSVW